ncbi:aminopeptidase [bacterium]|nr:aminopeptidase [bacterium]
MITDTSFLRNKNYHNDFDTIDTLNFDKMTEVVKAIY